MWEGKSNESQLNIETNPKGKSKVSVSQPISGRPQMHQPSRADHLGTQNQSSMMPTAQPVQRPPQVQQQPAARYWSY